MNLKAFALGFLALLPALLSEAQLPLSSQEIFSDYADNAAAADAKYLNKAIAMTVKVASIEKTSKGEYFLAAMGKKRVRCFFANGNLEALSKLKKDDETAIHGICKGLGHDKRGDYLIIAECKFGLADEPEGMKNSLATVKRSLVIMKGADGVGSGFIASIGGVKYVVSNFHVFDDNEHLKPIDCDNREIPVKAIKFASDRDIALFELEDQSAYEPLAIQPDIATLPVGIPVRVYGNSLGGDVFTEIGGKTLGSGPSLIEVDAGFVHGNSGCPVLSFPSLKVIGVATSGKMCFDGVSAAGTRFANGAIRRFATRIDNIDPEKLETYDKVKFDAEMKARKTLEDLLLMKLYALACLNGVGVGIGSGGENWTRFLLYSGKIPDSGKKTRLVTFIQQWNKEVKNLGLDLPVSDREEMSVKAASRTDHNTGKLGMDSISSASINKLPFDDLYRLLFMGDPQYKFSYRRIQAEVSDINDENNRLQKEFKTSYENIKALLKK